MKRRYFPTMAALVTLLLVNAGAPVFAQTKTLKMVPHADLKILDPTFTTAYISRNFGYMVYDTLFAQDASGQPKPQMVDKYTSSKDGKNWSFTLRPGLKFSDGSAVTSADAIASIQRWSARDSLGRAMLGSGAEWKAVDANRFELTLRDPFGMVLESLARTSGYPLVILPERLAKMPATSPLNEVLGSGPYIFKRDEWVPGNKVVFVRNPYYVARSEPPSAMSGNKKGNFERVEWLILPDSNSAIAALKAGEVDLIESLPPDYVAPLRTDPNVTVGSSGSWTSFLVFNHLYPPFDKPKARQAILAAVDQKSFTTAMGFSREMRMDYCPTLFICGSHNETSAGSEPFRKPDIAKAKQLLAESGYNGEKVVLMVPTNVATLNAGALMAAQTMRSIGMNVDMQNMDWGSITARRAKRDKPDAGGWNMFFTLGSQVDADSPITNAFASAACGSSVPGWPCDKKLDELRASWITESVPAKRKVLLDEFQRRAFETVPYVSAGQYSAAFAARSSLKGLDKLWAGIPQVWMLDK